MLSVFTRLYDWHVIKYRTRELGSAQRVIYFEYSNSHITIFSPKKLFCSTTINPEATKDDLLASQHRNVCSFYARLFCKHKRSTNENSTKGGKRKEVPFPSPNQGVLARLVRGGSRFREVTTRLSARCSLLQA